MTVSSLGTHESYSNLHINYWLMGLPKSQSSLYIFQRLLENGFIKRSEIISILSVSEVTFRRYIQELRAYLVNFNEPYEIVYNKTEDIYYLQKV